MKLPSRITLCEVGLRDGLQNETRILQTSEKLELVNDLIAAGFKVI
ncbi:MAG: hydroxymethylglutaryl-CoA lyase, partial [Clostridiales bacterium]|nr:hydroxymethylglutaryl-CoA lyase [Clostridiales bacterium]